MGLDEARQALDEIEIELRQLKHRDSVVLVSEYRLRVYELEAELATCMAELRAVRLELASREGFPADA